MQPYWVIFLLLNILVICIFQLFFISTKKKVLKLSSKLRPRDKVTYWSLILRECVCVCLCVVMVTSPASWISATCSLCGLRQVASSLQAHFLFCKVGLIRLADKVRWSLKIKCTELWAWAYCSSNVAAIIIVFVFPKMSRERTLDNFKALLGSLLNACTEVGTPASTPTGEANQGVGGGLHTPGRKLTETKASESQPSPSLPHPFVPWRVSCDSHGL